MTTKLIGLKDFRQNIAAYTIEAKKKKIRFIVLKKNTPVLEVKSVDEKEFALEKFADEIAQARQKMKEGEIYTEKQIMEEFGLL